MAGERRFSPLSLIGTGLRSAWRDGYGLQDFRHDIMAGLTIGAVAIPLSMALAIATGVAPQHGLYTAIVAGLVIALTGGSRFNVSGPTAAFVVILFPIVQQHGVGGLLIATLMAGMILLAFGLAGFGRLIQFVPYPVVLGFTAGIATVIAVLQLPDFLGLETGALSEFFTDNLARIIVSLPGLDPWEFAIGAFSLAIFIWWPKLRLPVPAPLVGLVAGALAAYLLNHYLADGGDLVETIASRFTWQIGDQRGTGIPPLPPTFMLPWQLPGGNGEPLVVDFALFRTLLGPAFAIAILGAIESLLCAVVADGLTHTRHDPNGELVAQGLGNMLVPFFGGITATAALARTATNIRSGARSPIAAAIHALVVLGAVVGLSGLLGMVPMAALAALLLVTAWNMGEVRHVLATLRSAPAGDVAILVTCFTLTVVFDMVLAVAVGMGLASALFIRRMAELSESNRIDNALNPLLQDLPASIAVYDINGPMFFGAAEKALTSLRVVDPGVRILVLDMKDVPTMDGTAIVALKTVIDEMANHDIALILSGLPARIVVKLQRAGIRNARGRLAFTRHLARALTLALRWHSQAHANQG
ncbi:MAG: C4-dicarboxylic acid transporter DauA [Porticoccaceae bacterium]